MKRKFLLPVLTVAAVCVAVGCAKKARYVQTGGHESLVTVSQINIQDYIQAATKATGKLLASGVLDKVPNPPAILGISRIINNTSQQIDTDLLVKRIRVALLQSGKALTTTTFSLDNTSEDPMAKALQEENEAKLNQRTARTPDFTLSGKIIQTTARDGRMTQSTYSFQLSLTDPNSGLAVWEGEEEITKQGERSSVGF